MKKATIKRKGGKKVKTSHYIVKSIAFNFKTHKLLGIGYEKINLITNSLFSECIDEFDIEDVHESFWNRLNPIDSSWYQCRREIVKVIELYPFEEFKTKFPKEYQDMGTDKSKFYPTEPVITLN